MKIKGKYKNGHPNKASRFICLNCMKENNIASGLQRKSQRERYHVKDLTCLYCGKITKNIEVRYCDWFKDVYCKAEKVRTKYY